MLLLGFQVLQESEAKNVSSAVTDQIPTTKTSSASIIPLFHRAQTHLEIYSQTCENQSLSKGPIQNILLTLLLQEPSFLRQRTLINGI